jgi:hypothetical protein
LARHHIRLYQSRLAATKAAAHIPFQPLSKCTFQGGATCGAAIWGERIPAIVLSFGFVIF